MSKICDLCGRGPTFNISRSHSNVATNRRVDINLQPKTLKGVRCRVCTKCIKTLSKVK